MAVIKKILFINYEPPTLVREIKYKCKLCELRPYLLFTKQIEMLHIEESKNDTTSSLRSDNLHI